MKNALIKPVLSLKNKTLLLDWWKEVEGGNPDAPLPPESEIFKSGSYSSFIFLYFKMATEVNVFAHLGQKLLAAMKESLFSDTTEEESDEEEDVTEKLDNCNIEQNNNCDSQHCDNSTENNETHKTEENSVTDNQVNNDNSEQTENKSDSTTEPEQEKPKTITSMYGKVYTLKK